MRRAVVAILSVGVLAVALGGLATPAGGGEVEPEFAITLTKVVEGTPPPEVLGYEIVFVCDGALGDVVFFPPEGGSGTEVFPPPFGQTCTYSESAPGGAQVSISCEVTAGPDVQCLSNDTLVVGEGAVTLTVTNTFDEPEPEPAAEVVEAEPAFTG